MEMDKFSSSYQPSWPPAQATVDVVGSVETYAARQEEEKVEALEAMETPATAPLREGEGQGVGGDGGGGRDAGGGGEELTG
uniref:Uncharacterized protein n=1 Tax=Oryza glumipatula TaxID=40148 RepID=A0A0D9YIS9_9ORYZ